MKIYLSTLMNNGACPSQCNKFEKIFGNAAEITPKNIEKAFEEDLDIDSVDSYGFEHNDSVKRRRWAIEYFQFMRGDWGTIGEKKILWACTVLEEYEKWSKK